MTAAEQQLAQFCSQGVSKVALWADSSYGPLEQGDILKLANEINFPLCHFTCSFGAGLTVKGDFHDPAGHPAEIVIIEMGYNDESSMAPQEAAKKMRQQKWYKVLAAAAGEVKFVIFVHQPTYRQVCPPRPKKKQAWKLKNWVHGALVEGSKWTDEAMQAVQELGIQALCLKGPPEELFAGLLTTDAEGTIWQNEAKCRSHTSNGKDYSTDGELALWEDSEHPTAAGAETHFRCLVKAFKARYETANSNDLPSVQTTHNQLAGPRAPPSNIITSAPQQAWINQPGAWQAPQAWMNQPFSRPPGPWSPQQASWHSNHNARSQPYG